MSKKFVNKKTAARRALLMSVLSLILCFAMLIGTTFAWFTDSVTSGTNQIIAGNLDVELLHKDKGVTGSAVEVGGETKLFDDVKLWEPGAYCYETFTVKNVGNLALKYTMVINAANANDVNGRSLDEVLQVKVVNTAPTERPAYDDGTALKSWHLESHNDPLYPVGSSAGASEKTFTVVVYWAPTDHDNDWNMNNANKGNVLSANLGVTLVASQLMYEEDSFGNDYDNMEVATEQPSIASIFEAMSKTVENGVVTDPEKLPAEIVVQSPITLEPTPVQVGDTTENLAPEIDGATTAIVLNDTMSIGNTYTSGDTWGGLRVQGQSARTSNVTFKGNENGKYTNVNSNVNALVYVEGWFNLTFESGTYETKNQIISANMMGGENANQHIIISGGTFKFIGSSKDTLVPFIKATRSEKAFIAHQGLGGTITITGGTFYNCNPTGYVATGYKVVSTESGNDMIYTVVAD